MQQALPPPNLTPEKENSGLQDELTELQQGFTNCFNATEIELDCGEKENGRYPKNINFTSMICDELTESQEQFLKRWKAILYDDKKNTIVSYKSCPSNSYLLDIRIDFKGQAIGS